MKLESAGKSSPNRKTARAHTHPCWELIYNAAGSGTMVMGDQQVRFGEGTVVLCPPGMAHDKYTENGFTDYYIQFSGFDCPHRVYVLQDSYDRRLLQLIRVLHGTYYENAAPSVCESLTDAILGIVKPMLESQEQSEYVRMLRDTIIDCFTDPDFLLREAMEKIPLNSDHLRRRFKAELGMTPGEYLTYLRMEYAKKRLNRDEKLTVAEVAFRAGYYDPLYFSRAFKKYTGVPPSQWK